MVDCDQPASRFSVDKHALGRFLRRAQKATGIRGEVNVLITSDDEMRRLNRDFRGKDKPTDVLSFPPSAEPVDGSRNGTGNIAGDIAISAAIAKTNAGSLGHAFNDELKILLLHGLLHLAGYNHETDAGEMAELEQSLRAKLKLPGSLIERTKTKTESKKSRTARSSS